jgi:hypothetical protein
MTTRQNRTETDDELLAPTGSRRDFLGAATAGALGLTFGQNVATDAALAAEDVPATRSLRDTFWMFGVPAGINNTGWGVPRPSRMTPTEAAFYLGTPNLFMITVEGNPPMPYDQYAVPFRALKRFAWALVGSGGRTAGKERDYVLGMPHRFPNMVGFFMDDFFHRDGSGALTATELQELRGRMVVEGRKLDLYVVLYTHQLHLPVGPLLEYCDKITFWTWKSEELANLERNFERLEKLAPDQGKLLGLYMWDYGNKGHMPVELMRRQCELGFRWLEEQRLEGLIFLGSAVSDIELPAVEWSRKWISEVGDERL